MKIIKIIPKDFGANSYIITADGKNAVIIDCAFSNLIEEVESRDLTPVLLLLTHCHFDHVGGVEEFYKRQIPIAMSDIEKKLIGSVADLYLVSGRKRVEYSVSRTLSDKEEIEICGLKIQALLTSGHTAGSMCYIVEDIKTGERVLFTGDTLFADGGYGRTDFPTGNEDEIKRSLEKISDLEENMLVYCGHGEDTDLFTEKEINPYMKRR